jgi:hypothetical protein
MYSSSLRSNSYSDHSLLPELKYFLLMTKFEEVMFSIYLYQPFAKAYCTVLVQATYQ